ncbi:unnamed protein product, partial [Coregonus sp. 'balchen']
MVYCMSRSLCLLPVVGPCPSSAASTRRCHSIYKGFAQCLMALGDSLTEIWESLRQESKKMQFSGNLYDMCSSRNQPAATADALSPPNQEEINQESLKAHTHRPGPASFWLLPL